ncbi:crotonobetainyl-CoA:carnitine CoA-transferase CaiB-like acyl-CoA transferase [Variovorax paradoxus]|uniref:CaiB/BaiF CoA transferase family protein n=1 Tax=Variovorax paradoxus TaxID=34073 RepID=UPI00277EE883|nr:CaiB/BaiF CoA-transferase family protein [Variovorax paradoxus]MDP9927889.1 crotonobetainyl-CoA:carnitine CoA-transferase CaiB-like acyl-CoA transferase [Variovorax paradoxus]MDQ0027258.1 crotonobetainyl-CoA:carnitine CoA-transferase CaiB-like acyl-CoA transferase [Variovorax paradoxus]
MSMSEESVLSGVVVLDAATYIAAPLSASVLAEFGAQVIKIEHPRGDPLRRFGTKGTSPDASMQWLNENRNKRSVTLDLSKPEGRDLFIDLAKRADVVVENFRPGTFERWGLDWETLHAANRRLVMLRLSAFGQNGPLREHIGLARIAHAFSGVLSISGEVDRPPANPGPTSLADYVAGVYGALGLMLALFERERSGLGQVVDLALYEPMLKTMDEAFAVFNRTGFVRQRFGSQVATVAPTANYECADGRFVTIGVPDDKMFARLSTAMSAPHLADSNSKFTTNALRVKHRDEIENIVRTWVRSHDRDTVIRLLQESDVPCAPILDVAEVASHPQVAARENFVTRPDGAGGTVTMQAPVPKLSRTPGRVVTSGPSLGEATDDVLRSLLGLSNAALADLRAKKII